MEKEAQSQVLSSTYTCTHICIHTHTQLNEIHQEDIDMYINRSVVSNEHETANWSPSMKKSSTLDGFSEEL